jgi:uncharacterized membrane protein (UPF0127 family)
MDKKTLIVRVVLILILAGLLASYIIPFVIPREKNIIIHNYRLSVEIPKTMADYQKGLSGRKSIRENQGMLFIFEREAYWPFWMQKMYFPIDIIWLDKNCQVVYIERHLPPCERETNCPSVKPNRPAQYVLETVAGFTDKYHVYVGEQLDICKK